MDRNENIIAIIVKQWSLLFMVFFFGIGQPVFAQFEDQLGKAAEAYSAGNYDEAIQLYKGVIAGNWESFEVYYNLGNAYYKSDQIAPAILNYERAAQINPLDEDLTHNLNMARNRTVDKIDIIAVPEFVSGYKSFVNNLSADSWGTISLLSFILMLGVIIVFLLLSNQRIKQLMLGLSILLLFLSAITFLFGWQQTSWRNNNNDAIIFQSSITAQSTPDENGEELFVLHEGTKVRITERFRNWVRIRIGDGKNGWIKEEAIEEI